MIDKHGKCPECGKSWKGDPIPKKDRESYSPPYFWSKIIGIEFTETYDGVSVWMCPFCRAKWDGFTGNKLKEV